MFGVSMLAFNYDSNLNGYHLLQITLLIISAQYTQKDTLVISLKSGLRYQLL